jgi:hypothetical protein
MMENFPLCHFSFVAEPADQRSEIPKKGGELLPAFEGPQDFPYPVDT